VGFDVRNVVSPTKRLVLILIGSRSETTAHGRLREIQMAEDSSKASKVFRFCLITKKKYSYVYHFSGVPGKKIGKEQ
jgi:hypothetical protein